MIDFFDSIHQQTSEKNSHWFVGFCTFDELPNAILPEDHSPL